MSSLIVKVLVNNHWVKFCTNSQRFLKRRKNTDDDDDEEEEGKIGLNVDKRSSWHSANKKRLRAVIVSTYRLTLRRILFIFAFITFSTTISCASRCTVFSCDAY